MKTGTIFSILLFLFMCTACRKTVNETNPELVGMWRTDNTILQIQDNGEAYWGRLTTSVEERIKGPARVKNNQLIIGDWGVKKQININAYPHLEPASLTASNTVMVLNDEKFFKFPGVSIDHAWRCSNGVQDGDETAIDCGGDCDACPTCNDHIKNQDETGVDCGGACQACQEAPCYNALSANNVNIINCQGHTIGGLPQSLANPDATSTDSLNRYTVLNVYGQWEITVLLPRKPRGSLVYNLTDDFAHLDETSDYNSASIQIKRNSGVSAFAAYSMRGRLFVTVTNSVVSLSFCDVEFSTSQYGCMRASGKLLH